MVVSSVMKLVVLATKIGLIVLASLEQGGAPLVVGLGWYNHKQY
jgi:hypothetical protein